MLKKKTGKSLSFHQKAKIFQQLKQLEQAGLPLTKAISILAQNDIGLYKPLMYMQKLILTGKSIAYSGYQAGIFSTTDRLLIAAAETSGQLEEIYYQLANYYFRSSGRVDKIKSRLYLPGFVFLISIFLAPLPLLLTFKISLLTYLQVSLGKLAALAVVAYFLLFIPKLFATLGLSPCFDKLQMRIPGFAPWLQKRQLNEFFRILALLLESGINFEHALPKAVGVIKNSNLKREFDSALSSLGSGDSVYKTLTKVRVIKPNTLNIIHSGEHSGKLAQSLMHYSHIETDNLALQDDLLAEWIPRLIYGLVAADIAVSIISNKVAIQLLPNL